LPSGSVANYGERHPDDYTKIAGRCGLIANEGRRCDTKNFFSKNSIDNPTYTTGLCRTHTRAGIFSHFAMVRGLSESNGNGQKDASAVKRKHGRQKGDLFLNRDAVKADLVKVILGLSITFPEHEIKRKLIAAKINGWGESIDVSTVTRRVHMVFGENMTVAEAVALVLRENV
jgi:hypothetical protein